ncbi:MAG: hypothetical protein H0W23_00390 [Chloroflexia bacterium]|nr:hypothetical protein [Chloroflexia bacterium]
MTESVGQTAEVVIPGMQWRWDWASGGIMVPQVVHRDGRHYRLGKFTGTAASAVAGTNGLEWYDRLRE